MLDSLTALDLRGYATLEASFGPGAHLIVGPNAAGQDEPARGHRPARLGPLAPDERGRRARSAGGTTSLGSRATSAATSWRSPSPDRAPTAAADASGSASTASGAARRPSAASCGSSCSRPRRCSWSSAPRRSDGPRWTPSPAPASRRMPTTSPRTDGRSSSATACCGPSARSRRPGTSCASGTRRFLDIGRAGRRGAAASARGPGGTAGRRARRDRPRRGRGRGADPALRDERAGTPRRDATGRAGAPAGRDRRQGGLERLDGHRAAPRRPGLRPGRSRPARRSRRAASSARRSSPSSWPSWTCSPSSTAARRCCSSTTSSASSTRTGARTSSGGSPPCRRRSSRTTTLDDLDPALRGDRPDVGASRRPPTGRPWSPAAGSRHDHAAQAPDAPDRRAHPRRGPGAGARGGAAAGPRHRHVRGRRRRARAGGGRGVPGHAPGGLRDRRRGRRADRGPGDPAAIERAADGVRGHAGRHRGPRACACTSVARVRAYNPRTCQPSRGECRPIRPRIVPVRPSSFERPAWPPDSS